MDAYSLAMDDAITDHMTRNSNDLNNLIVRVERMEEQGVRVDRLEGVIEDLQRRLHKAEQRISPFNSHAQSWRRIRGCVSKAAVVAEGGEAGGTSEAAVNNLEDGGELRDRDIKLEEEYQIPMDIYSVVSAWKWNSRPFWIALVVISIQILLLSLLLVDQIGSTGASALVVFPANVPAIVHASQALATVIAIFDQDDLRSAIENYFDGLPTRFKGDDTFQSMTVFQWNFACFVRFVQGFLSVFASFILAVQSETVFDVLLNFLGVKFVSELDDLSFCLGKLGYFGEECERATKRITEVIFQQDNRNKVDGKDWNRTWFNKYAHVIGVFGILSMLMGLFLYVLISQTNGDFSAQVVKLTVGEEDVPFAALFGGCYRKSPSGQKYERRLAYEQIGFEVSGGKFGFCGNVPGTGESAWIFMIGEESTDPCRDYVARTEATDSFDILDVSRSQWFSIEGVAFGNLEVATTLESSPDCEIVDVNRTVKICDKLDLEGYIGRNQREFPLKSFYKTFVNRTGANVYTYQALTHPIFVESTSTPLRFELLFFTGQSWVLTEVLKSETTGANVSMQTYMDTEPEFKSILLDIVWLGKHVGLVTASVASNTVELSYTPSGLRWFRKREPDRDTPYNYPTADQSRPVDEILLSCASCDDIENPCSFGGQCLDDGTCACVNGGVGALCKVPPSGDSICNRYFNTEVYGWDGGDCCGGTCVGPQCGLGGIASPFGIENYLEDAGTNEFSVLGYGSCEDPSMAPLTIELKDFDVFNMTEWYSIIGEADGDPFCSTAAINVRCNGITYLHFPQYIFHNESDCGRTLTETIHVPFGSQCELSTNDVCFGTICLNHTISVYYGNDASLAPIRSGNIGEETRLSFGVPSECLTGVLRPYSSAIFDVSTHQGQAASSLSNDGLSEFLCAENPSLLIERYALSVLNASVHFKSSNWEAYQCHGWGIPAVQTGCTNVSVTALLLEVNAGSQAGTIPTELFLLTNLRELALRSNNFTSTIPTEIGLLSSLQRLELWDNELSGTIPTELGMCRLSALALAANKLTGTIPTELGLLSSLTGVFLDENSLTGPIPSELAALPLATLSLAANNLSGTIPTNFAQSLQSLLLYSNPNISGTIPTELANLKTLFNLAIVDTNVTGQIPSELGLLSSSLVVLELWANQLSGPIPSELSSLTALSVLALASNKLTGTIPTELGLLSNNLDGIYFADNILTGAIPTEFGLLSANLRALDLSNNQLENEIPFELLSLGLNFCSLANNNFSGGVPPANCAT